MQIRALSTLHVHRPAHFWHFQKQRKHHPRLQYSMGLPQMHREIACDQDGEDVSLSPHVFALLVWRGKHLPAQKHAVIKVSEGRHTQGNLPGRKRTATASMP